MTKQCVELRNIRSSYQPNPIEIGKTNMFSANESFAVRFAFQHFSWLSRALVPSLATMATWNNHSAIFPGIVYNLLRPLTPNADACHWGSFFAESAPASAFAHRYRALAK